MKSIIVSGTSESLYISLLLARSAALLRQCLKFKLCKDLLPDLYRYDAMCRIKVRYTTENVMKISMVEGVIEQAMLNREREYELLIQSEYGPTYAELKDDLRKKLKRSIEMRGLTPDNIIFSIVSHSFSTRIEKNKNYIYVYRGSIESNLQKRFFRGSCFCFTGERKICIELKKALLYLNPYNNFEMMEAKGMLLRSHGHDMKFISSHPYTRPIRIFMNSLKTFYAYVCGMAEVTEGQTFIKMHERHAYMSMYGLEEGVQAKLALCKYRQFIANPLVGGCDVWLQILRHCEIFTLANLSQTCRMLRVYSLMAFCLREMNRGNPEKIPVYSVVKIDDYPSPLRSFFSTIDYCDISMADYFLIKQTLNTC